MSLAAENIDLVERMATKLRHVVGPRADREELIGSGMIGLVQAERLYVEHCLEVDFRTYATTFIRSRMVDFLRKEWGRKFDPDRVNPTSLDASIGGEDGDLTLLGGLPDPRADVAAIVEARETLIERLLTEEIPGENGQTRQERSDAAKRGWHGHDKTVLSPAEIEVLAGFAAGESTEETGSRTGRSGETVKSQRKSIIKKLGARNMANATYLATRAGLFEVAA